MKGVSIGKYLTKKFLLTVLLIIVCLGVVYANIRVAGQFLSEEYCYDLFGKTICGPITASKIFREFNLDAIRFAEDSLNIQSSGYIAENADTSTTQTGIAVAQTESIENICPEGTNKFLADQKIEPQEKIKCYTKSLPVIMDGSSVTALTIVYGKYNYHDDVVLPLEVQALIMPSGELEQNNGISILPTKFNYYAGSVVGKIYGTPFPHDSRLWWTSRGDKYISLKGDIEGPNSSGDYCGTYSAVYPAVGTIQVCGKGDDEYPVINGGVTLDDKVLSYDDAVAKGKVVADTKYSNIGIQKNYLNSNISKEEYNPEIGAWILFYYLDHQSLPGGVPDYYHTALVVKVDNEGNACLVTTYHASDRPDLKEYSCDEEQPAVSGVTQNSEFIPIKVHIGRLTSLGGLDTSSGAPTSKIISIKQVTGTSEPAYGIFIDNDKVAELKMSMAGYLIDSPDNRYVLFKGVSIVGNIPGVYLFDTQDNTYSRIPEPRTEQEFDGNRDNRTIIPYIESYMWTDDSNLKITFYYMALNKNVNSAEYGYNQVSPKEIWNYNLATQGYSFVETMSF